MKLVMSAMLAPLLFDDYPLQSRCEYKSAGDVGLAWWRRRNLLLRPGINNILDAAAALTVTTPELAIGLASSIRHPMPSRCTSQGALNSVHRLVWEARDRGKTASNK